MESLESGSNFFKSGELSGDNFLGASETPDSAKVTSRRTCQWYFFKDGPKESLGQT